MKGLRAHAGMPMMTQSSLYRVSMLEAFINNLPIDAAVNMECRPVPAFRADAPGHKGAQQIQPALPVNYVHAPDLDAGLVVRDGAGRYDGVIAHELPVAHGCELPEAVPVDCRDVDQREI